MSLQFVLGNSGSGKSTFIYNKIIEESIKHPERNYLIIVPEQFTMSTQKRFVDMHPMHAIMNIDVLSFNRLAYRVFDELGIESLSVLEETGKNFVLRYVAGQNRDALQVFGDNISKLGYITQMKSAISELAQYDISPDEFEASLSDSGLNDSYRAKAADVLLMYRAFRDFTREKYITSDEILVRLNEVIADSEIIRDATVVFDGFTGFTPLQNNLLYSILPIVMKSYVTVTIDRDADYMLPAHDQELFKMSKDMIQKTTDISQRCHVEIAEPIIMETNKYSHPMIAHLEQNIFRNKSGINPMQITDGDSAIKLCSFANPREELEYVAASIAGHVRSGKRYKNISIACADLESYKELVDRIFKKYDIPYFIDTTTAAVFHPLVEFICALFEMKETGFDYEGVFHFLRCGMSNFSDDETDYFESYIKASGVRGFSRYSRDFEYEADERFVGKLDELNDLRRQFIEPILPFCAVLSRRNKTVTDISRALYDVLIAYRCDERLKLLAEMNEAVDPRKSSEYSQIYSILMDLLDKLVSFLGDEIVSASDYLDLLLSGLEGANIGAIPHSSDCVTIGDIERTRYEDVDYLYLIGAIDSVIPKRISSGGLFTQQERVQMAASLGDKQLAPTDREKAFMQRFYLYMILSKPACGLYLTSPCCDIDSCETSPSSLYEDIRNLFVDLPLVYIDNVFSQTNFYSKESAYEYISDALRIYVNNSSDGRIDSDFLNKIASLLAYFAESDDKNIGQIIDAAFFEHQPETLEHMQSIMNYESVLNGSVSKLENYARCPYSFFLNYILDLKSEPESTIQALDLGNLYHDVLEKYAKKAQSISDHWDFDDERSDAILDEVFDESLSDNLKLLSHDSKRDAFMFGQMKNTLRTTTRALKAQVNGGAFIPSKFEVWLHEISTPEDLVYELDSARQFKLTGKIDRMDMLVDPKEDVAYIKIIDYKSGKSSANMDFEKVFNGLQLQMFVYMDAAVRGLNHLDVVHTYRPGALYYQLISNPIINLDESSGSVWESQLSKLRGNGVCVGDVSLGPDDNPVLAGLDVNLEEKESSLFAKVALKAGYKGYKNTDAVTPEEYDAISQVVNDHIVSFARSIADCKIDTFPIAEKDVCKYCDYKNICKFDDRLPGYNTREFVKLEGRGLTGKAKDILDKSGR